jgi:hypothetical protein
MTKSLRDQDRLSDRLGQRKSSSPQARGNPGKPWAAPRRHADSNFGRFLNGDSDPTCPLAATELWRPVRSKRRLSLTSPYANHLIRAGTAVAGYADLEAAVFPVKLAPGYMGAD